MPKQPDSVRASDEDIEMFLVFVTGGENELMEGMLEENPTLINAVDDRGDTAVNSLISSRTTERHLVTLEILMRYEPDLTIRNENGYNAWTSLRLLPDDNIHLFRQVVHILDPSHKFHEYGNGNPLPPRLEALARQFAEEDTKKALDEAKDYFETKEMKDALDIHNQIVGVVYEIKYDNPNVFLDPMEQQKQINRFNAENIAFYNKGIDEALAKISFAPGFATSVTSGSDLEIIVAPKEILALFDNIGEILSGLTQYFLSDSDNH